MKGVFRLASMRNRVYEWTNHFTKLYDRPGPSMSNDEGSRSFLFAFDMHEVNVQTIKIRFELRKCIQAVLGFIPVIFRRPVLTEFLMIFQRYTLGPVIGYFRIRPASVSKPNPKIFDVSFWYIYFKLVNLFGYF